MRKVKLGDVADTCLGKMLDAKKNTGKPHPYLANVNVRWGSFDLNNVQTMPFEDHETERYSLKPDDLVMCEGGEPGRCALWKDPNTDMRFQKALHRIRAKKDKLDIRYLYYWFLYAGKRGMLDKYFTQTTIKHLVGEDLRTVEIDLPELNTQQSIADTLSIIDSKIETNGKIIAELESLARTMYDYWFTQFDFPDENGNPYRSSGGTMVHNDTLHRDIPEGWKVKTAAELVSIDRGISYSADELSDTGKPMINLASFNMDGTYKGSGLKRFTGMVKETKLLSPTDLVMCATQQTPIDATGKTDVIAKSFLVPDIYEEPATMSMDVVRLVERRGGIRFILNQMLRRSDYHKFASGYASGTKIKHLDVEGALSFPIALPKNQTLLDGYATLSANWQGQISAILKESVQLTALRDWLLPFLMNGQAIVD